VGSPSPIQTNGDYTPSLLDTAIPFGIGVVATVAVATVVCAMGRRRAPSAK
jgi:hypothetical protein